MTQRTYATSTGYTDYGVVLFALDARPHESLYDAAARVIASGEGRVDVAQAVMPAARVQWECIAAAAELARRPRVVR